LLAFVWRGKEEINTDLPLMFLERFIGIIGLPYFVRLMFEKQRSEVKELNHHFLEK